MSRRSSYPSCLRTRGVPDANREHDQLCLERGIAGHKHRLQRDARSDPSRPAARRCNIRPSRAMAAHDNMNKCYGSIAGHRRVERQMELRIPYAGCQRPEDNGAWNSSYSMSFPINNDGSAKTLTWDGCIEERQTLQTSSTPTFTINSDQIVAPNGQVMKDLDIDAVPSQADSTSLWGPRSKGYHTLAKMAAETTRQVQYRHPAHSRMIVATIARHEQISCRYGQMRRPLIHMSTAYRQMATPTTTLDSFGVRRFMSPTGIFSSKML